MVKHKINFKSFKCNLCNKSYSYERSLQVHIKSSHPTEEKFKCATCDMSFKMEKELKKHSRTHLKPIITQIKKKDKKRKCQLCNEEFDDFRKECPNCKNFYQAKDFLELSQVIKGSKFLVTNQGFLFTIAESIKIPRLLETNNMAANNIPEGGEHMEALFQDNFKYWFDYMLKKYK
jgi:hypothetical protein